MAQTAATRVKTGFAVLAMGFTFIGDGFRSSFGVPIYLLVSGFFVVSYVLLLIQSRKQFSWRIAPTWFLIFALTGFIALLWAPNTVDALNVIASYTLPAIIALGIATLLPWPDLVRALGATMRWLMGLWLITQGIFWAFRFEIPGLLPTGVQLAFVCLIALSVFGAELYDRTTWRPWTYIWLVVTIAVFALQFSVMAYWAAGATITIVLFVLWARAIPPRRRLVLYLTEAAVVVLSLALIIYFAPALSSAGFGTTWLTIAGTMTWFGVLALALVCFGTLWRSWFIAVDRPRMGLLTNLTYQGRSVLPLLITVNMIVYSFDPHEAGVAATWLIFVLMTFTTHVPGKIQLAQYQRGSVDVSPSPLLIPEN